MYDYVLFYISKFVAVEEITRDAFIYSQIRDFKIQRRGRQRERQKKKRFNKQNSNFARASRFVLVHFSSVFARLRRENA